MAVVMVAFLVGRVRRLPLPPVSATVQSKSTLSLIIATRGEPARKSRVSGARVADTFPEHFRSGSCTGRGDRPPTTATSGSDSTGSAPLRLNRSLFTVATVATVNEKL